MLTKSYNYTSKAFTLIELLVVISIIGLLSSVVFASVNSARERGSVAAGQKFDAHTHSAFFDDLVVSWDFDRDAGSVVYDNSGNANNLNISGGAILTTEQNPFQSGKVIQIEASKTAQASSLKNIPSGNFSISFWVYPTMVTGTHYFLNYYTAQNGAWRVGINDSSNIVFNLYYNGAQTAFAPIPKASRWYHVMAVCNNNKIGLYINGKLSGTIDDTNVVCAFDADNTLNLTSTSPQPYYLDNVRIYKNSLPI